MLDFAQLNMDKCKPIIQYNGAQNTPPKDFIFPRPPQVTPCSTPSFCNNTSDSDTQSDSSCTRCRPRHRAKRSSPMTINNSLLRASQCVNSCSPQTAQYFLPPIGVFWDIENCQVPKSLSAVQVAQTIRDVFFEGYREAEFVVVCDVTRESNKVIKELTDAQVNLIHVPCLHKNAADEKLRQSMRRFADLHNAPAAIILITGDINFIADVCDLRHRRKLHVILLHQENTSEALMTSANEHYDFKTLFKALPSHIDEGGVQEYRVHVYDLPRIDHSRIKIRLKRISENCGGKVTQVFNNGSAVIVFKSQHHAVRAAKRMDGVDVYGNKISVGEPQRVELRASPTGRAGTSQLSRSILGAPPPSWSAFVPPAGSKSPSSWKAADLVPPPTANHSANKKRASNKTQPIASKPIQLVANRKQTPSPYGGSRSNSWEKPEDQERYFHPINAATPKSEPVELQVTNLDQSIEPKDMKKILMSVFGEHVMVLHVSVFIPSDGQLCAYVKVSSLQDAQYAISQLHRRKVGYRRIIISYASGPGGLSPQLVRAQIVALLQEVPTHRLPLFKFCELFESRYLTSVSVSEMYKMRDVCLISDDDKGGRFINLNPDHRQTPSPIFSPGQEMEMAYCPLHMLRPGPDKGWAEQEVNTLPNVRIGLKLLTCRIHSLVQAHKGSVPLPSLARCYEAQFAALEADDSGVPLEHLLSCLPGVEIAQGVSAVKFLRWAQQPDNDEPGKCASPPLAAQQTLFARELVDLLKTSPHCLLSFNRFIPAYHHHFGRQCRVADYGYTKLADLLEALPHIVQVMGEGNRRVMTLAHRAQVRRFTSDLLRLLKAQASKQVALSEFADVYHKQIGKEWDIVDYGVCDLADMLSEVSQTTVSVTRLADDVVISIPKREQTSDEATKTCQFAFEVVELLSHAPQCQLPFNKFIPAYHHHFGRQCRLADYGLTKLVDLFEAIPHVAKMCDGSDGDRLVSLTTDESVKVLTNQMASLLGAARGGSLLLAEVPTAFKRMFGFALKPETYGCQSVAQLIAILRYTLKVECSDYAGPIVSLADKNSANSKVGFHDSVMDAFTLYNSAPKPDSPAKGLPIELPPFETSVDPSTTNLTSPCKYLLEAHKHPVGIPLNIVAPDASALPMPTAFNAITATNGEDRNSESADNLNASGSSTPSRVLRKPRLAAQFSSPIES